MTIKNTESKEWVNIESDGKKLICLPEADTPIDFWYSGVSYLGYFQDHDEDDHGFYVKATEEHVPADFVMKWRYISND